MKNLLIFTILILFSSVLPAQNIAFHENFEPPSFADSVTSSQTVPGVDDWALSSVLASKGQYSDSCTTITGATSYLTTEPFTTTGKYIVHLDFDQICKLDFLDIAMIEISTDNGALWLPLTGNEYLGSSLNFATLGRFISSSYGNDWLPGDATAIPDNTWWKHEKFDISTLAGDKTSVMIRFKLQDGGVPGPGGNYGWLIDEIIVRASVSELDPPLITMIPPVYTGHIYNLGPFPVKAVITDASGIDEAYVVYNVNSGINDTITMTPLPADTFLASIPAANHLDTICYHVVAIDASLSQNLAREPMNSCNEFVASAGVIIPYYNSLDWLGSLSDFIITNTTYGRVHHNVAAANTGAGGMVMDASAQTNWTTTLPDTTNPFLSTYIWNPNTNPTHFAQARLTLFSQGYTALYLKFDLKQLYYGNNLYTHFRVVVNGTQITPHFTPKGSTTQYNTYEFDLTQFLPATSLVIDFESKVRYPFTGTTTNGNFIDNILVDVPPQQEAYLIDIIEPVGGCGLGNEPVTIRIKNKGTDPIVGNMTASYMLLGSSNTVTEPVNDLIVPGDTLIFTFNTPVNLSTIGIDSTFEIMSYINLAGDPYTNNDTAYGSVFSAHTPPDPIVFNANIPYGTYTTLTAISNDSLYWFDVPAGGIEIATGPSFTTPVLYGTTVYYVEARSGIGDLKLTEILQFKSGSGYTNPYPPYCPSGDWDGIEITNMGSAPVDMTGYTVNIVGAITVTWSPPAGTILNAGEVLILSFYGTTAVPSPQNNFFVTPTSTSVSSASLCGYFIKDPAGVVIDACASNGYQFQPASGVTSADWSGNLPSSSGNAGIVRIASDNNTASDWSISSVTPQTIGSVNPSLAGIISGGNGCPSNRVPDTVYVGGAPPLDGSITGIYSPNSDYNLTAFETVTVKIKNYGTLPFSNFPVGHIINGGTPVIETINNTIAPGDTLVYTFNATADLSLFGIYEFKAFLSVPGDLNQINDTAYKTVENMILVYCPSNATSTLYDDIGNITLSTLNNGIATPVTSNPTANGTYSDFTNLPPALLTKGNLHPISISQITSTTTIQPCYVKVFIDYNRDGVFNESSETAFGGLTSASMTTLTGNIDVPLNAVSGLTVMRVVLQRTTVASNVKPCGTYTYGETEDYLVMISPAIPKDAGVIGILQPSPLEYEGNLCPVEVTVKNFGTDTIFAMDIAYKINGGTPVIDLWTGILPPSTTMNITLPGFIVPALDNNICAYTMLIGDINLFNNQTCKDFYGHPQFDPEAVKITSPVSGCGLSNAIVTLEIYNDGHDTITSGLSASYYLLGGSGTVTEQVNLDIPPDGTISFNFTTTVDLTVTNADSTFEIIAYVSMPTDPIKNNDTTSVQILSGHVPPDPVVTNVTIPYATSTTITAVSNDSIFWYDLPSGGVEIATGASYTTPVLFGTTVYWAEAKTGGGSGIIITEIGLGSPDFIEIQNVSNAPVDATGWVVAISDSYTDINKVNSILWNLTNMSAGEIRFREDVSGANYWGNNMFWNPGTPPSFTGWAMIIDDKGEIVDFVIWGWNDTQIQGFNATINGYNITIGSEWIGDGIMTYTSDILERVTYDNDDASDYINVSTNTKGLPNPNLTGTGGTANGCPSNRVPDTVFVSSIPPYDISVVEIQSPVSDFLLTNSEPVRIKVKNYGTLPVSGFPVSYKLNNGTPVTDTIYATLNQGDTIIHTFSVNANLAAFTIYNFKAYLSYPGDMTLQNDTAYATVENKIFVYCDSYANYPTSYEDIGNVTISNLNNGNPLPVTSNPTAVNGYSDFTYLPPVQLAPGVTYPISISVISASTSIYSCKVKVYIDYNRDGIFDQVAENAFSATTSSTVTTVAGNVTPPLSAKSGITMMRVVLDRYTSALPCGTYSYGETEDYLVMMAPLIPQDAGVTAILNPGILDDAGNVVSIEVTVQNFGTAPITSMDIAYEVNGGVPVVINYSNPLAPAQTANVTLPNYTIQSGDNFICAYTILAGDSNTFNDAKCKLTYGQFSTNPPYTDNFDSPVNLWWNDSVPNEWERGVPDGIVISYPHSQPNVWMTDLDDAYSSKSVSYLYSPKFSVLSAIGVDSLKFWHFVHTQPGDGGNVQYLSTTGWRILGMENDPNGVNWYNSPTNMWTINGIGPGWRYAAYNLKSINDFAAITQFRFVFYANSSTNNTTHDGWAIDDFRLIIPKIPVDGGIIEIIEPKSPVTKGTQFGIKLKIKNFGTDTLYSIPLYYKINNGVNKNGTWNGVLYPDSTTEYTFPVINSPWNNFNLCAYTELSFDTYLYNDGLCETITVDPPQYDAGIQSIAYPKHRTIFGNDTTISVWLKNYGLDPINSCDLEYSASGVVQATETWTGTLAPGDSVQYTFSNKFNHTYVGYYYMKVYTKLASDGFSHNDTVKIILESFFSDILESELTGFTLSQNIPNPTSGNTIIEYSVPYSGEIRFLVFNYLGQMMIAENETVMAGEHRIELNVNELQSGLYFYMVEFDGYRLIRKMIVNR